MLFYKKTIILDIYLKNNIKLFTITRDINTYLMLTDDNILFAYNAKDNNYVELFNSVLMFKYSYEKNILLIIKLSNKLVIYNINI